MLEKKILGLIFLCISISQTLIAQEYQKYSTLIEIGDNYYKEGKFEESLNTYQSAFKIKSDNIRDLYNGACTAALTNNVNLAFDLLEKSLINGWHNADKLEKDPDLYNLHSLPKWKSVVNLVRLNSRNTLTTSQLSYKIEKLIESNNPDEIRKLSCESCRLLIDEKALANTVEKINELLLKYDIKNMSLLSEGTRTSSTTKNGTTKVEWQETYRLTPNFFGQYTNQLFYYPLAYEFRIILEYENSIWKFSTIEFIDKYLEVDYDLETDIKMFFNDSDSIYFRFGISTDEKFISGNGWTRVSNIDFIKKYYNLEHFQYKENTELINLSINNYFSLLLEKKINKNSTFNFSNLVNFDDINPPIHTLEFIFNDNDEKKCFISNGQGYGFYEMSNLIKLKKYILSELYSIK